MKPIVWIARMPWAVVLAAMALVALGWLGIARAEDLAGLSGRFWRQQMIWSALAAIVMYLATLPSYRVLARWSYAGFAASLALLAAVYFFPAVNGAHRWIRLGPVGFQPSELAKIAFVLAVARYLMVRDNYRTFGGLLAPLFLACVPVVLILREPDLGTSLIFVPVLLTMLYVAGARTKDLGLLLLCGVAMLPALWTQMSHEQRSRVTSLFQQTEPGQRPQADGYQLHQSKQLLALGGLGGSYWVGESADDRAAYHLPESHTDFVFSVLGERFGWLGLGGVLTLFALLVWRATAIAEATRDPFGRLVAAGIAALLATQAIINTGMTVGLLPVTGLSLPLVSYGGSGMLAHALALGLLLNIGLRPGYEVAREPFRFAH